MAEERRARVQPGMQVVTSDNKMVGFVTAVDDARMRVEHLPLPDLEIPFDAVYAIAGDRVILNMAGDELKPG
ncbi:MAG TPA: DUF2171 domain-containing protein [Thermomicrobiaceae bacterium]|nr:DUF2171 domain-containing protein [Thermomicrobiaceae bacterium]